MPRVCVCALARVRGCASVCVRARVYDMHIF